MTTISNKKFVFDTKSSQRVADVIAEILARAGIHHVFMVTGGGAMHLNDALGKHPLLEYVACHHEQTCSMAADSYFRMSGKLAAVNVTTGPGGTNAITGVFGAWTDSIGMVVISGQVKWETLSRSSIYPIRQLGDQEVDIIKMIEGITKYSVLVTDAKSVRYHLEKAIFLARTGRPGPVWIDVPISVQATPIIYDELISFSPESEGFSSETMAWMPQSGTPAVTSCENNHADTKGRLPNPPSIAHTHPGVYWGFSKNSIDRSRVKEQVRIALDLIFESRRPIIMTGGGIRASGSHKKFIQFAEKLGVPVATCWNAHDVIWDDHPLYAGRPGSVGNRGGNFSVQNSDCILVLGSRLNIRQISYNWEAFGRNAKKIMVDIDLSEIQKHTLSIDVPIHTDLNVFFDLACELLSGEMASANSDLQSSSERKGWIDWCKERLKKYPVCNPNQWEVKNRVNPYCFVDSLFRHLEEDEWIVTGDGTACVVTFQGANLKKGQRLFTNSGCASMGFDIPAAIGVHFSGKILGRQLKRFVCIAGDGSIQMNLQDIQTLVSNKIPAKLFVLNNQGYHSIRQTQHNFFNGHVVGCGEESGLRFPSMEKIAHAYNIPYSKISNHSELEKGIEKILSSDGLIICEIILDLKQAFEPKLSSKRLEDGRMVTSPLEDMFPFLTHEELMTNMLVEPLDVSKKG